MLKTLFKFLLVILSAALLAAAFMPKTFGYSDAIQISASAEQVWQHTSSIKSLNTWSPWMTKDPKNKIILSGEEGKIGSSCCWESQIYDVGKGCQWIKESVERKQMVTNILFERPRKGPATAYVDLSESKDGTTVSWRFTGDMPWPTNIMIPWINRDIAKNLRADWKNGLTKLKELAEASAKVDAQLALLMSTAAASEDFAN